MQGLRVVCILLPWLLITSAFTKQHYVERICDDKVLSGYEDCLCDYRNTTLGYQLKVVNCTDKQFSEIDGMARLRQFSSMLDTARYTELEGFIFVGNDIPHLPENLVGRTSLENLAYLDLSRNKIHSIKGKTFHSMPDLTELRLDDNDWYVDVRSPRVFSSIFNLETLSLNNAFATSHPNDTGTSHATVLSRVFEGSKLDYLTELYLENNRLYSVDSYLFQNLISLKKVSLAHNYINNLSGVWNSTCFPSEYVADYMSPDHMCSLESLDLSFNSITTVPKDFLEELGRIQGFHELNLTGNRFVCDCNLLDFYDWLRDDVDEMKYTIPDHQDLTCNQPEALSGRAIIELQRSELICQKSQWDKQSNNAPTIVLSVMFGLIACLLLAGLFMYRAAVLARSQSIWTSIWQKLPQTHGGYKRVDEPIKTPVSV